MSRRTLVTRTLIAALVAFLLYSLFVPPHYSWRQKLTVTISTPNGPVEGSAVTQVDVYDLRRFSLGFPDASGTNSSFTGEAVAVEVSPGKVLFVLLGTEQYWNGPVEWPNYIWSGPPMTLEGRIARITGNQGLPPEPLPQEHWPIMVTFGDLSRPETLQLVTGIDLSYLFGPGVKLDGMTIRITDEPVTTGRIKNFLPWFLPDSYLRSVVTPDKTPPFPFYAFLSIDHWRK
jgi:hypothetical protein